MSWLCPVLELEWHQALFSMVGVPCKYHIPKGLQQRQVRTSSQCSLTTQLAAPCRCPSSSLRAGSHLDLNPWSLCEGPQGVSPGSGHAGPVQFTLSLGSCSSQGLWLL